MALEGMRVHPAEVLVTPIIVYYSSGCYLLYSVMDRYSCLVFCLSQ